MYVNNISYIHTTIKTSLLLLTHIAHIYTYPIHRDALIHMYENNISYILTTIKTELPFLVALKAIKTSFLLFTHIAYISYT